MLRELQSATGEELRPFFGRKLLPSVLDKAFKGELRDMSEFKQRKNKFIEQFKYILEKYGKSTALLERSVNDN